MTNLPIATALRKSLKGYNITTFRYDVMAAFVVSLLALPLSMALSIAVGLPPQHGIYTAIVAGIIVPLLGGSMSQVSGPTAAFVVILEPIVSQLGLRGIIWCGIIAGIILIIMGFARLGRLIHYIPYPVTTGFTAGIAVVLATLSLNDFLGLRIEHLSGHFIDKASAILANISHLNLYESIVGVVTLILLFIAGRFIKIIPSALVAIFIGTLLAIAFTHYGFDIQTIGTRFSYLAADGATIAGIPPYPPIFHLPTFAQGGLFTIPNVEELRHMLPAAGAIAILAALESLLSATVADSMVGTKHDPNAELTGIGVGNIMSALASGIPATGALARTATAINNHAKTPISSSVHAIFIMVYISLLAPYISYVPMTALAALLIHTAYSMSHHKSFMRTIRSAPKSDVIVLLTCFLLTVFIDMVAGVGIGMVCAAFLLIKHVSDLTTVETEDNGKSSLPLPDGTLLHRIRGPIFFGTVEKAFDRYNFTHDLTDVFILDISEVPFIDMTGLVALKSMLASIASEKRTVKIVCDTPDVLDKIKMKLAWHNFNSYVQFYPSMKDVGF